MKNTNKNGYAKLHTTAAQIKEIKDHQLKSMNNLLKTNKDLVQFKQWIKALRSGKYQQGKYTLQDENGYCCLGVACRVVIKNPSLENGMLRGVSPSYQDKSPEWLKKVNEDVNTLTGRTGFCLMSMNDSPNEQYTFNEIADVLELLYIHKSLD